MIAPVRPRAPDVEAAARAVRLRIAHAMLGHAPAVSATSAAPAPLGDVRLHAHQRDAVARLREALATHGGALLADHVGLGKTFVALALAGEARAPLVVAPAALRASWGEAMRRTGLRLPYVTIERLSRVVPDAAPDGVPPDAPQPAHDLVIVDEAHHFRNPRTRRYAALAALARGARVLLLSATPVHNDVPELDALLALFLGSRAAGMDDAARARCIVRRSHEVLDAAARPPRVRPARPVHVALDDGVAARLLALPPPLPVRDGGAAGALAVHGLLRLWASSGGALRAGLRRRLAAAEALAVALADGHHLDRDELRRWVVGDDAVQLGLLLPAAANDDAPLGAAAAAQALATVHAHREAVRALLRDLPPDDDQRRAAALRALRVRHQGEKLVAFTQFADTVHAYRHALRADAGVCTLTAAEALVAGGRLARQDALRRFAPLAHGAREPPPAERITLLLSTDVVSEGLDLVDASVVVHLDLPWTPARLEQRVGRLARLGSPHAEVTVYVMRAPAAAQALLEVERRLQGKSARARRAVGAPAIAVVAANADAATRVETRVEPRVEPAAAEEPRGPAESAERLRALLAAWRDARPAARDAPTTEPRSGRTSIAAVRSADATCDGFLALVVADGVFILLAGQLDAGDSRPPDATDDPALLLAVARCVTDAPAAPVEARLATLARDGVRRWWRRRRAAAALGAAARGTRREHARLLARLAAVMRAAPLHRRAETAARAARVRHALARALPVSTERALAALAGSPLDGVAWLRALGAALDGTAARVEPGSAPRDDRPGPPRLVALLLVRRDG